MSKLLDKLDSNGSKTSMGDNPVTEDELDRVLEDSFPASDPPSHTPTTSLGGPTRDLDSSTESEGNLLRSKWAAAIGGVMVLAVLIAFGRKLRA